MIPLKLELKNFMAYREAEALDLSGLHVVCLTGDNGAGKSTLLDAVTWAIWGQARAKRDDELIAQGATEMRVALTFQEGKEAYQIVRMRKLGKAAKGKAVTSSGALDFFIRDEPTNGWRTLSEGRAAETQAKIERVLNLSYDTFINSAYLKQGRADEFTLKPPGQRKELLGEILSLHVWQDYELRAKDKLAALERELGKLSFDLKQCEDELSHLPEYERQLGEAQSLLLNVQGELQRAEGEHREMALQRERAQQLRAQVAQTEARMRAIDADAQRIAREREGHAQLMQGYQQALDRRDDIERGYADLEAARASNEQCNLKLSSMVELNARKTDAEHRIADARRALESVRDAARRRLDELTALASVEELQHRLAEVRKRSDQLHAAQIELATLAQQRLTSAEQQAEARAQNDVLKREMNEIKQRMDALGTVGAICPTCGRELHEDDRARLLEEWRTRGRERGDQYRANDALMKSLNERRSTLDGDVARLEGELRNSPAVQREEAALQERLSKAEAAAAEVPPARAAFEAAQAELSGGAFAADARKALSRVEDELAELGYDAAAHKALRDEVLPRLSVFVNRKAELDRAALGLESERRAVQALKLQRDALDQKRAAETEQLAGQNGALADAERALVNAAAIDAALKQAQNALFDGQRRVGAANQRVQACRALESTVTRLTGEIEALTRQQALLEELRLAFSKNGVPAMIIESVLPELEASSNELLGRMTNGRMNVRFETQRLTQKGDTSETLEIRISDELGERSYELFSGGEAFRINFAVRIALSKLLARRAGASLRTLFIDEGFGTQDAQGRERLVEAIKTVESDFDRLFVITHIDELKDAFPARIEVTKTPKGSVARVV